MKLFRPTLALAACALFLTACGEEAADTEPAAGPTLDDAKAVVTDYMAKGFSGDAAACALETKKYSDAQNESEGAASCEQRVESIKVLLTDGEPLIDVAGLEVVVKADGDDAALADVTHATDGFTGALRLVVEDGAWKIDEDVADDAAPNDDEMPLAEGAREVSEGEAIEIEKAFCAVEVGTPRVDVDAILGEPTKEGLDEDGTTEVEWIINNDYYTVWFADDAVAQYSSSTPREVSACQ